MKSEIPLAGVAHEAGNCRFGTDPRNSVLDVNCKGHEVNGFYVADTSFFPSIVAVNPSLTAMADAPGSATICSHDQNDTMAPVQPNGSSR